MSFPDRTYPDIGAFFEDYAQRLAGAAASVDRAKLAAAGRLLAEAHARGSTVYSCGNGGSASIANHLACDHLKGVQTDTPLKPRVVSLATNVEVLTAVANDLAFDEVFVYQLRTLARAGDLLIAISASGNSENVVRAAGWARDQGLAVLAFTGFDGGRLAKLATLDLHVEADNYGVIEDTHQTLMHALAQYLRLSRMDAGLIAKRRF